MNNLYEKFADILDTAEEILLETENEEKEGWFVDIYVIDTEFTRSLLTKDGKDPLANVDEEIASYGDNYIINFYAEYYPFTEEVAIHVSPDYYDEQSEELIEKLLSTDQSRIKDGYIQLTENEKNALRDVIKDHAKEEIEEMLGMESENERD